MGKQERQDKARAMRRRARHDLDEARGDAAQARADVRTETRSGLDNLGEILEQGRQDVRRERAARHQAANERPTFYWDNLASLRVWWFAFAVGLLFALLSLVWSPLWLLFFPGAALGLLGGCLMSPAKCPDCLKRVKLGASRCRHCGVQVS